MTTAMLTNSSFFTEIPGFSLLKLETYKTEKKWRFFYTAVQFLPKEKLLIMAEQMVACCPFLEQVELIPCVDSGDKIAALISQQQSRWLSAIFDNQTAAICFLNKTEWEYEAQRVKIYITDSDYYHKILKSNICSKLSAWLEEAYALNVVCLLINDTPRAKKNLPNHWVTEQRIDSLSGEFLITNKNNLKKKSLKRNRQLLDAHTIPIKDIEEGSGSVVTSGIIYDKDITLLRNGRIAVTYLVTDYEDSIWVKTFYDEVSDDPLQKGDWITLKGNARFDNFLREVVVFIDAYAPFKYSKRSDDCQLGKRIELHAHTSMSALDALTRTEELVKRAYDWGHKAIAITDHGSVQAFPLAYAAAKKLNIKIIYGMEGYLVNNDKKERPYHIILLAQNLTGLQNLYYLISISYMDYFYRKPKIPRQVLIDHREGLLLGSACQAGELYQAVLQRKSPEEIQQIAAFYDYLEIQPISNNAFLLSSGTLDNEADLADINKTIFALGNSLNKPVVATGDVHFLEPFHERFRAIIQAGQGYKDVEEEAPLYFKTTQEMLDEFAHLGPEAAIQAVITAPNELAASIEDIKPVPDGFYPPQIDTAADEITALTWNKARQIYGDPLPDIVQKRLLKELNSITKHGFSVLYLIAHKLVAKSNSDGYLVGSRGSVGSSLVAYMTGITDVNSLKPHYVCPVCRYNDFSMADSVEAGVDLPDKVCPNCGHQLNKAGFDIPFETFLGFEGDKVPDIDLNFSGDYQPQAHHYIEELFGKENVFRAGTVSTIAEKTAFGFVKKYCEDNELTLRNAEIKRLAAGITGVKRTTGQHPGGMIVVPKESNILKFTPLQYPADKKDSGVVTTHFEYHALEEQLIKLDILGHDDPTVIKAMEDMTGVHSSDILLGDADTMQLFSGLEPLGVAAEDIGSTVGTYGIPEFGTSFVRKMLEITQPKTFAELVRISGLSHGTNVWSNNAHDLIINNTATLKEVICTRDDIMIYLLDKGIEKKPAFNIMEHIRKGKGLTEEEVVLMKQADVPEWYIESCQKIKYMFPKAHAVAYVSMAFKIAWFKIHYPLAFYASFFSIRGEDFEAATILDGAERIKVRMKEIDKMGYKASQKEKKLLPVFEVALEMYARGFNFCTVDIEKSAADKFKILADISSLLLPFNSLPNVGENAACGIVDARNQADFVSVEDFQNRTHLNKSAMEILQQAGCFRYLPESTQINLFA